MKWLPPTVVLGATGATQGWPHLGQGQTDILDTGDSSTLRHGELTFLYSQPQQGLIGTAYGALPVGS